MLLHVKANEKLKPSSFTSSIHLEMEPQQFLIFMISAAHLHLQDLLQSLHDDQRGFLDRRVTVLGAVLDDLHQSLVGSRAQVVLVTIRPAHERIISARQHPSQKHASHSHAKVLKLV